jgi:hypothetical protein
MMPTRTPIIHKGPGMNKRGRRQVKLDTIRRATSSTLVDRHQLEVIRNHLCLCISSAAMIIWLLGDPQVEFRTNLV